MWFLIKGSVWFAAVLVVLSYFSNRPATETGGAQALQVANAFQAASEAYQYVSAICTEKPDVCEKGAETVSVLGVRAKEGARVAFELLDKQFGSANNPDATVTADPNPTPMPAKLVEAAAAPSDTISTGTIKGNVPIPQKRPAH